MNEIKRLKKAKTDEEKSMILDEITFKTNKQTLANILSTVVCIINFLFAFFVFFVFIAKFQGDITFEAFPPTISNILKYIDDIFENLGIDYFLLNFLSFPLFVIVATASFSLIVRLLLIPIKTKSRPFDQKPIKDKLKSTSQFIDEKSEHINKTLLCIAKISVFLGSAALGLYIAQIENENIFTQVVALPLYGGLGFGIFMLLLYVLKPITIWETPLNVSSAVWNFWLTHDPEEKKRLEREKEAIKQGFIHLAAKSYSSSSSYSGLKDDALDDLGNAMAKDYGSNWSDGM